MCDHTNAHDRPITVWCIGSRVGAHKETICQTHINVPSPYGDLEYEIESSHTWRNKFQRTKCSGQLQCALLTRQTP